MMCILHASRTVRAFALHVTLDGSGVKRCIEDVVLRNHPKTSAFAFCMMLEMFGRKSCLLGWG